MLYVALSKVLHLTDVVRAVGLNLEREWSKDFARGKLIVSQLHSSADIGEDLEADVVGEQSMPSPPSKLLCEGFLLYKTGFLLVCNLADKTIQLYNHY